MSDLALATAPIQYKEHKPIPNNDKNIIAPFGFGSMFLLATGTVLLVAALASMIIPFIVVAASLLVVAIVTIVVIKTNKKLYENFFHVFGICKLRIESAEKRLNHCNLVPNIPGFQKENKEKPRQYANTIFVTDDHKSLTLMATPTRAMVDELSTLGYKTIVSMQEPWEEENPSLDFQSATPEKIYKDPKENIRYGKFIDPTDPNKDLPITQHLIATADCLGVKSKDIDNAVELVNLNLKKGHVAVHCKSGLGRSAKVIAAYLYKYQGLSMEESINAVAAGRIVAIYKPNEFPNLYEYACYLIKKESEKKDADPTTIENKITQLKAQMDTHVDNLRLKIGEKAAKKLQKKLDQIFIDSDLKSILIHIKYEKLLAYYGLNK